MTWKYSVPAALLLAGLVALTPPASLAAPHARTLNQPQTITLKQQAPDPDGSPRPARNAVDVPLRTSIYFQVDMPPGIKDSRLLLGSVTVSLQPEGGDAIDLLVPGWHFVNGATGWLRPAGVSNTPPAAVDSLCVYIEPGFALKPSTKYTIHVGARAGKSEVSSASQSSTGLAGSARPLNRDLPAALGTWSFTTEATPAVHPLTFPLDLASQPVVWHGHFWSGFCNITFCTQAKTFGPTYDLMAQARKEHPNAWSYQRDFWLLGTGDQLPNIVRERETRRIKAIEKQGGNTLLSVEDFYGHEQYGIPSGRPLSEDYHRGNQVIISGPKQSAVAKVIAVDDQARTILVTAVATPAGGWKIEYEKPLPRKENPDEPGLFATGGCYLHKLKPHGTACYYWGRLDKEWDLAVKHYGRRVQPNFTSAPADLAIDGREFTTCKDYLQWHEAARIIAGHIIDRYGPASLHFTWSIFNEPDLGVAFWRCNNWMELQKFYDYTSDAILRAFEDRGYDSHQVFIGGLELGGIFGTNLRLNEFLAHCSPSPKAMDKGALLHNAAFADARLAGLRSRRVEELCRASGGKGAPCDFISVHTYNRAEIAAGKLIEVKETALAYDPVYYRNLWANTHESCPDWAPPPDEAANDSYRGDGYFPSWCVDVVSRQLAQAAADPRYAYGETILTTWGPLHGMGGLNSTTRILAYDDQRLTKAEREFRIPNPKKAQREVTIPFPVFSALNLLSDLGERYWVLPQEQIGGHRVSGFASRDDHGVIRVVLCAHHEQDTQSRSDAAFDVTLNLQHVGWDGPADVEEYRFDREHNTYYPQAKALPPRPGPGLSGILGNPNSWPGEPDSQSPGQSSSEPQASDAEMDQAVRDLESRDISTQHQGLKMLRRFGLIDLQRPEALERFLPILSQLNDPGNKNKAIREAAGKILWDILRWNPRTHSTFTRAEVEMFENLSQCRVTGSSTAQRQADGTLTLTARVEGNGVNFLVIRPDAGK